MFHLQSFVTQDSSDRDFLVHNLKQYDVPILNYVGEGRVGGSQFEVTQEVIMPKILSIF